MNKVIQIKNAEVIEREGKEWVELTDSDDKVHRIFPKMKRADGTWLDMSDKVGLLISQVQEGVQDKWMQLTKEKVGQYYNVIDFQWVKEGLEQKAAEKFVANEDIQKTRGVALRMATDIQVARLSKLDKLPTSEQIGGATITLALLFESYISSGATQEKKEES